MAIKDCIKLKKALDPADLEHFEIEYKAAVDGGLQPADAYTEAAEAVLETMVAERNELAAEIRENGGQIEDITLEGLLKAGIVGAERPGEEARPPGDFMRRAPAVSELGFYSAVEKAVLDMNLPAWKKEDGAAKGKEIWAKLKGMPVKKEELEWLGIEDWLMVDPEQRFTRNRVTRFIANNGVQLVETQATEDGRYEDNEPVWSEPQVWNHRDAYVHYIEDMESEFLMNDADGLFGDMNEWMEEWIDVNPEDTVEHYTDRMDEEEFAAIEDMDVYDQLELIKEEHEPTSDLREMALDDFRQEAEDRAYQSYMEDPDYIVDLTQDPVNDNIPDIYIFGSDNRGWIVRLHNPIWGEQAPMTDDFIGSLAEARLQATLYIRDAGYFDRASGEEAAQYEDYVMPGDYSNYREIKLKVPGIDYTDVHFASDPGMIAWMRVTERDLWTSPRTEDQLLTQQAMDEAPAGTQDTYFIEELQSGLHQHARTPIEKGKPEKYGYRTEEDIAALESSLDKAESDTRLFLINNVLSRVKEAPSEVWGSGQYEFRLEGDAVVSVLSLPEIYDLLRTRGLDNHSNPILAINKLLSTEELNTLRNLLEESKKLAFALQREREGAPNAPFKNDAHINLVVKRALTDAAQLDSEALAWTNAAEQIDRWSDQYARLYKTQYDQKMVSIVKKLTGQTPQKFDRDGRIVYTKQEYIDRYDIAPTGDPSVAYIRGYVIRRAPTGNQIWGDRVSPEYETKEEAQEELELRAAQQANIPGYWAVPLTEELKEKIRGEGLPLFKRRKKAVKKQTTVAQLHEWLDPIIEKLAPWVEVELVERAQDIDPMIRGRVAGYHHQGKAWVVAAGNKNKAQAIESLTHEVIGHVGLEVLLGQDGFTELVDEVRRLKESGNKIINDIVEKQLKPAYTVDGEYQLQSRQEAREILAFIAQRKPRVGPLRQLIQNVWNRIKMWFADHGLAPLVDRDVTNIESYVLRAAQLVQTDFPGHRVVKGELKRTSRQRAPTAPTGDFARPPQEVAERRAEQNRRIREEHVGTFYKAKRMLRRYFAPGGLLPRLVFQAQINRDSKLEATEMDIRESAWGLERAFKKAHGRSYERRTKAQELEMSEALAGNLSHTMPEDVAAQIEVMRQKIDAMTDHYLQILEEDIAALEETEGATEAQIQAKEDLLHTIVTNMGQYVHRSYRAFDDPLWPKNVPEDVLNNARDYLEGRLQEKGMDEDTAIARTQTIIEEVIKENTAFDSLESFIKESKLGARELSVLKKKKDIAPEIRALLGEHKDPRVNFAKTMTKMARLVYNDAFLKRVKEIGMGSFLFEAGTQPEGTWKTIAAKSNEAYKPLNGLKTTPEFNQALIDAMGDRNTPGWLRTIIQVNGGIKFGKTVLSPTTTARNWMSAMFFALANGHFNLAHIGKSITSMKAYFTQQGGRLAYLKELKELGVIYDTPYAGEMMRLLEDTDMADRLLNGRMQAKHMLDLVQKFYQFGDDFWKIVGYENEIGLQMKYRGLTREAAKLVAAERVRNTYPTYSMVGKAIHMLRRNILVGTFVSFPAEIIRTSFNIMKYAKQDYADSKALFAHRMAGLALASSWAYVLQEIMRDALGVDDDEDEAVRDQLPEWSRNSNLLYLSREGGNLHYIDLTFMDPYNILKRPLTAMTREEPFEDRLFEAAREFLEPFLGQDIGFGAIAEIYNNKKETGGTVFNEADAPENQLYDIANHARKRLQPGVASNIERTIKAARGEVTSYGKRYELSDEMASWIGFRVSTLDPAVTLRFSAYQTQDTLRNASKVVSRVARDPNPVSVKELRSAFNRAQTIRKTAYRDLLESIAAARKSGVTTAVIRRQLIAAGLAKKDATALSRGKVPRKIPTHRYLKKDIESAGDLLGAKARQELIRRRNLIIQWSRSTPLTAQ